jgi:hypothetical protein
MLCEKSRSAYTNNDFTRNNHGLHRTPKARHKRADDERGST